MRDYKRNPRFTKRLEATFSSGEFTGRGILSDISENGLFIRTTRGFAPGTDIDIELVMPDGQFSRLAGVVRRTLKTSLSTMKNGMGVELTQKDAVYKDFLKTYLEETGSKPIEEFKEKEAVVEGASSPEFLIITCASCGVKNKVSYKDLSLNPKCGKCNAPLPGA